jgi:Fur family ferric uptake transcriptional regulator
LTSAKKHFYDACVTSAETMTARLAQSGYRVTGTRREVLRTIIDWDGPFTIEELALALPAVGRATVYRTVKVLQEADLVCRMTLEDGSIRYGLSQGEHHHHLICSACGRVTEFADADIDARIALSAERFQFELAGHSLELYGLCHDCS